MCLPVERSTTVSPPQRIAQVIFSTSSAIPEVTAELPMLALIFTRKFRPMIIGSDSGWLMFAGMMARDQVGQSITALVFTDGDEFHFRGHRTFSCVVQLSHDPARLRATGLALQVEAQFREHGIDQAFAAVSRGRPGKLRCVAAFLYPSCAQGGEALPDVDSRLRVGVATGGIVDVDRRIFLGAEGSRRIRLKDLAHRHPDVAT